MTRRHFGIRVPKPCPTYTCPARAGSLEGRRLHLGYRSHSDCPGCRSLWGEQDRHRRCEHHHVSATHDWTGEPRTHRSPSGTAR